MSYNYNLALKFDSIVSQCATQSALIFDPENVSFLELDELSNQFAHFLEDADLKKGDVVAIFNDKSKYGYALMLACLKKGVIYTHLDPDSPMKRVEIILEVSQPKKVFSFFDQQGAERVDLAMVEKKSKSPIIKDPSLHSDSAAYIMFTSGSTGQPKGAVITHGSLLNFIAWAQETYGITSADRFTGVNPIYFDNSVFDFYASLFNGASLLPVSPKLNAQPKELVEHLEKVRPTIWFSVPSFLILLLTTKTLNAERLKSLRYFIFGGEGFPKPQLKKLYDHVNAHAKLSNVYGPTECTCICSSYEITAKDFEDMVNLAPLGKIAPNFDFVIEDGELILLGPNVGLGYYRNPEKTQSSFGFTPIRSYRTGDIVELKKGDLHFKGRKDFQIKHMGYRIELEEIEANLSNIPGVRESGVVYLKADFGGKIVGFVSVDQKMGAEEILESLRKRIPNYMMPKTVHIMDSLPKNQNGKIDRVALMNQVKSNEKK